MARPITLFTIQWGDLPLEEVCRLASKMGYEGLELSAVHLNMSGGKGRLVGVIFGALSYTVIDKIIAAVKVDSLINNAIKGAILIVAITIQVVGPQIKRSAHKKK